MTALVVKFHLAKYIWLYTVWVNHEPLLLSVIFTGEWNANRAKMQEGDNSKRIETVMISDKPWLRMTLVLLFTQLDNKRNTATQWQGILIDRKGIQMHLQPSSPYAWLKPPPQSPLILPIIKITHMIFNLFVSCLHPLNNPLSISRLELVNGYAPLVSETWQLNLSLKLSKR